MKGVVLLQLPPPSLQGEGDVMRTQLCGKNRIPAQDRREGMLCRALRLGHLCSFLLEASVS